MQNTPYACTLVKVAFSRQILKNTQKPNFMNIRPMEGELLHANKQTDMKQLTVDFRDLANPPKRNDIHNIKTVFLELYFNSVTVTVLTPPVEILNIFTVSSCTVFMCFVWFSEQLFCTFTILTQFQHCKTEEVFTHEENKFLYIRILGFQEYQLYDVVTLANNKQTSVNINTKINK